MRGSMIETASSLCRSRRGSRSVGRAVEEGLGARADRRRPAGVLRDPALPRLPGCPRPAGGHLRRRGDRAAERGLAGPRPETSGGRTSSGRPRIADRGVGDPHRTVFPHGHDRGTRRSLAAVAGMPPPWRRAATRRHASYPRGTPTLEREASVRQTPPTGDRVAPSVCSGASGAERGQRPAAARSASTRSVRSQVNSGSSRPKWP